MLIDEVFITLKAGRGGDGAISFFPGRKSGPDGGNGGNGGNVIIKANKNIPSLNRYSKQSEYIATNGSSGDDFNKTGADGKDLVLDFPVGTEFIDEKTQNRIELVCEGQEVIICRGGTGGRGNAAFKSSTMTTPKIAEKGAPGEEKRFKVIMKLIADYGLIGLPNAGKSSLLNELTAANVRTAPYPFTTLEPNLGALNGKVIADIPGLIEGASAGRGLGIKFLKHIEKVKLLLHCIAVDSQDVEKDYITVTNELANFNSALLDKEQIILLTKIDLVDKKIVNKKAKILEKFNKKILPISIHDWDALKKLNDRLV